MLYSMYTIGIFADFALVRKVFVSVLRWDLGSNLYHHPIVKWNNLYRDLCMGTCFISVICYIILMMISLYHTILLYIVKLLWTLLVSSLFVGEY